MIVEVEVTEQAAIGHWELIGDKETLPYKVSDSMVKMAMSQGRLLEVYYYDRKEDLQRVIAVRSVRLERWE